jgi:quercetin dioxygenase-like cupin family protein
MMVEQQVGVRPAIDERETPKVGMRWSVPDGADRKAQPWHCFLGTDRTSRILVVVDDVRSVEMADSSKSSFRPHLRAQECACSTHQPPRRNHEIDQSLNPVPPRLHRDHQCINLEARSSIRPRSAYRWFRKRCSASRYGFTLRATSGSRTDSATGGTNKALDLQNPDNLGAESTDNGVVPNLKWSFSDSKTRILNGGWVREQVVTDLPSSRDIAAAQQHLKKGALRELHWHRVAEWGFVYNGSIIISAVDENGQYQVSKLGLGDIWYFPKGVAHTIQGVEDENEYLLVFDDGDFDKVG